MPRAARAKLLAAPLPDFIPPQLAQLVTEAPAGPEWLHEVKFDGYRIVARIEGDTVRLLTRSGLDWTHKYRATAEALAKLPVRSAYLDGELCAVRPDGVTSFSMMQAASDRGDGAGLVFYLFDAMHLDGVDLMPLPLRERKARLAALLTGAPPNLV